MSQPLIKDRIPRDEWVEPGHLACPGCGGALALRLVLKGLGEKTVVVLPDCCRADAVGPHPHPALRVPVFPVAAETAAATAAGVRAALAARGDDDTTVLAWAGDGGPGDVGLQALSAAAERDDDILCCCFDDGAYASPGTPQARPQPDLLAILAAHGAPYAATACVAYPEDLLAKVRKAKAVRGARFLQILAPCPPGWESDDDATIALGRLAVQCRAFPLVEVEDGERWRFTVEHAGTPVSEYVRRQGRFRHLGEADLARLQQQVDARWQKLERRVRLSAEP